MVPSDTVVDAPNPTNLIWRLDALNDREICRKLETGDAILESKVR